MALPIANAPADENAEEGTAATFNLQVNNLYRTQQQMIIIQQNEDAERLRVEAERRHAEILEMARSQARVEMTELEQHADAQHRARLNVIGDRMGFVFQELQQQLLETQAALRDRSLELDQATRDAQTLRMQNLQLESQGGMILESEARLRAHFEQNEHSLANLRITYERNREMQLEFLGDEFREHMQYEENMFTYAMYEEEQACDALIQDLAESNQRLQTELIEERTASAGASHQQATTSTSAMPPGLGVPESSLPQGGAAAASRSHVHDAKLPDPFKIPDSLKGIFEKKPQKFNLGNATPASQSPSDMQEALAQALKTIASKDDSKPKTKEAETIKMPDFPSAETYRSWKTAVREAIRAASDHPDEAFAWVQAVYEKGASAETLRDAGKFLTLDTKILAALSRVAKGELARQILNYKETEAAHGRAVRGRQVLLMFELFSKQTKK